MPIGFSSRLAVLSLALLTAAGCARQSSATPASAPRPSVSVVTALPEGVTLAMVNVGDSLFHKGSCQRCHGMDAKGGERAPNLTDSEWSQISGTYAEIVNIVTTGVPKEKIKMASAPNAMRPRGGTNLTDEQIRQVAAYVYTLSHH